MNRVCERNDLGATAAPHAYWHFPSPIAACFWPQLGWYFGTYSSVHRDLGSPLLGGAFVNVSQTEQSAAKLGVPARVGVTLRSTSSHTPNVNFGTRKGLGRPGRGHGALGDIPAAPARGAARFREMVRRCVGGGVLTWGHVGGRRGRSPPKSTGTKCKRPALLPVVWFGSTASASPSVIWRASLVQEKQRLGWRTSRNRMCARVNDGYRVNTSHQPRHSAS